MTCGDAVSARERGRAGGAGEAGRLLGRAVGPSARVGAGARVRAVWAGPDRGRKEEPARVSFLFFFFK
jgi:hypothetical protein